MWYDGKMGYTDGVRLGALRGEGCMGWCEAWG